MRTSVLQKWNRRAIIFALVLLLSAIGIVGSALAQSEDNGGVVVADGFNSPQGILVTRNGSLWVVDSGVGGINESSAMDPNTGEVVTAKVGNTSRVMQVQPDGTQTEISKLPSVVAGTDTTGGGRLVILNGVLYATSGVWVQAARDEPLANTAAILEVRQGDVKEIARPWEVEKADNPDGFVVESHPYGMAAGPDGLLYVTDAGANTLLTVNPKTGAVEVIAVFDGIASPIPNPGRGGALESDPVPTGVAFGEDGTIYVSLLPGFPFLPGASKVVTVDPDTGEVSDYATGLTMLTDLRTGPDGELYGVQLGVFTDQGPVADSGAVLRIAQGTGSEMLLDGLSFPTSIDFDADGNGYVLVNGVGAPGTGQVIRFDELTAAEGTPIGPVDASAPSTSPRPATSAPAATEEEEVAEPENNCANLPSHDSLTEVLAAVVEGADNGGFGFHMWATLVDRDGVVCAVTFSGENRGDQWPGSRIISGQKANTANAFSLPGLALSTGNLYSAVQPGGSLFGLQESNPVDTSVAYFGSAKNFGTENDPMIGLRLGGVNVFGGGLALYDADGTLLGAVGVSGDSSCTDHIIAWKVRDALGLDNVPAGVSPTGDDNIVFDIEDGVSASGWGQPTCGLGEVEIAADLPESFPLGVNE
ncbi:MAG: ScyD/ScyE family protein [Caldilineaceae bacterium]